MSGLPKGRLDLLQVKTPLAGEQPQVLYPGRGSLLQQGLRNNRPRVFLVTRGKALLVWLGNQACCVLHEGLEHSGVQLLAASFGLKDVAEQ